jgi:hypothetical protein
MRYFIFCVSVSSAVPPLLPTAISILATVLHAREEVAGPGGPLWAEFGRLAGRAVPNWLGATAVAVVLPVTLATLAIHGYLHGSIVALSLLAGARIGDALFSHWGLWIAKLSKPNPGLWTSTLYLVEGPALLYWWPIEMIPALAAGMGFALVIPVIWLVFPKDSRTSR